MLLKSVKHLLASWQEHADQKESKAKIDCYIKQADAIRIQAFASTFKHNQETIVADIIQTALDELEQSIPYIPGNKIIRIEDGDPVYEDIGLMPRYLQHKQQLIQSAQQSSTHLQ